jgi:hypothetical protein
MKNFHFLLVILLIFTISLISSGCADSLIDQPQRTPAVSEPAPYHSESEESPETEMPDISERRPNPTLPGGLERVPPLKVPPVVGEVPEVLLGEIIADLVDRTGVEPEAIEVLRTEAVVWNDGSLGCPKPGEFYIQVLINGYWVVLEVEGIEYDYRANDSGYFTLCEGKGFPAMPPSDIIDDIDNPLVMQARQDLADRLGVSLEGIEVLSFEAVVWPDASMGCPKPGMAYIQVPQDGALIRLSAAGQEYDYHSGGNRGVFLCENSLKSAQDSPKINPIQPPGSADK